MGVVVQQLAVAIARAKLKDPRDEGPWFALCNVQSEIMRLLQHEQPYSDADAPSIEALERKADAVSRALQHMGDKRPAP